MTPIEVTDATFETEVLQASNPVLVDFWAPWCAPCRALAPIVEEIANEYNGKIKVCKMDTDANQQTAVRYEILSIPRLFFFKNGRPVEQIEGYKSKKFIVEKLSKVLA